jgi:pilus assembly protein Flp/PilA
VTKVFKLLNEVRKDEEGATMVEYALMVGLIAVVSVLAVTALGVKVNVLFTNVTASLP